MLGDLDETWPGICLVIASSWFLKPNAGEREDRNLLWGLVGAGILSSSNLIPRRRFIETAVVVVGFWQRRSKGAGLLTGDRRRLRQPVPIPYLTLSRSATSQACNAGPRQKG